MLCIWALLAGTAAAEEAWRVRIENDFEGAIEVSTDGGTTHERIGRVLRPNLGHVTEVTDRGFTAADLAPDSAVAATAANAIHIRTSQARGGHALLMTLQPRELWPRWPELSAGRRASGKRRRGGLHKGSYFETASSIFTDIPAGTGLFGQEYAPYLGDPVRLETPNGLRPLPPGYRPALGDRLVLRVQSPRRSLASLHFRNHPGGLAWAVLRCAASPAGMKTGKGTGLLAAALGTRARPREETGARPQVQILGRVLRPVGAVGRFGGTLHVGRGVIRANHPGVLDVSTSPRGKVGGFQIIPEEHARSPHLRYVWGPVPAWLVLGPLLPGGPDPGGRPPLFRGHLRPGQGRCQVRFAPDGPWTDVPERVGRLPRGLQGVSDLRILFP